jgi:hypothetical protein
MSVTYAAFPESEHRERLARARKILRQNGIDCCVSVAPEHHQAGGRLAPHAPYPSSIAKHTLRRQTPEVGAVCGKAARTVLCGRFCAGGAQSWASLPRSG